MCNNGFLTRISELNYAVWLLNLVNPFMLVDFLNFKSSVLVIHLKITLTSSLNWKNISRVIVI